MQSLTIRRLTFAVLRRHHCRLFSHSTFATSIAISSTAVFKPHHLSSSSSPHSATIRRFHISPSLKMSDEDYAKFLSKSQKDYSKPSTTKSSEGGSGGGGGKKGVSASKYSSIKSIGDDRCYTSEADKPFHEVEFDWEQNELPNEKSFAELVGLDAQDVETLTTKHWDPKGEYEDVTKAVSEAGGGSKSTVKVYKTAGSGARVIYYIVTVNEKEKKIIGVKATAVES